MFWIISRFFFRLFFLFIGEIREEDLFLILDAFSIVISCSRIGVIGEVVVIFFFLDVSLDGVECLLFIDVLVDVELLFLFIVSFSIIISCSRIRFFSFIGAIGEVVVFFFFLDVSLDGVKCLLFIDVLVDVELLFLFIVSFSIIISCSRIRFLSFIGAIGEDVVFFFFLIVSLAGVEFGFFSS